MSDLNIEQAGREVLWNVSHPANSVVMYTLFFISLVVFSYGVYKRFLIWSQGNSFESDLSFTDRINNLVQYVYLKKGVNRDRKAGAFHSMILWGFLVLLFTTTMVAIDEYFYPIYSGKFYLAVTILSDFFGAFFFLGLWLAYKRRYLDKPDKLNTSNSDLFMLGLLALMIVQGYLLEGMRISATNDPWAAYSPVGLLFSLPYNFIGADITKLAHFVMWWFHSVTVFSFIALMPYTKFFHIISSSLNIFYSDLNADNGALNNPGDIEQIMEEALSSDNDDDFVIGSPTIKELSWKQRLDLDACTSCGRCQSVCPAYASDKPLSPKWLILDLRDHMLATSNQIEADKNPVKLGSITLPTIPFLDKVDSTLINKFTLNSRFNDEKFNSTRATNVGVQNSALNVGKDINASLAGDVLDDKVFWSCTSCKACEDACPVGISHVDIITDVRRSQALMLGEIPSEAQGALRAIETRGNPFGPADNRSDWTEGLDVKILEENDEVDVLYWIGCVSAFDKRKQSIAKAMVKILNHAGVNWGMLGNRECCTGDPARRLGEENLFQNSAKQNIATINSVKFKKIVANCPHCFHSLKNEYKDLDDSFKHQIIHHTQFLQELIDENKLKLDIKNKEDITYHDPCYLGRYNNIFDEPRETLVQLGRKNVEMSDNKRKSKCCGAGGGHYWFDMKEGDRINVQRVEQAVETNTSTIATSCPFCMQMLEDGVKLTNNEEKLVVKDMAELVADSLG